MSRFMCFKTIGHKNVVTSCYITLGSKGLRNQVRCVTASPETPNVFLATPLTQNPPSCQKFAKVEYIQLESLLHKVGQAGNLPGHQNSTIHEDGAATINFADTNSGQNRISSTVKKLNTWVISRQIGHISMYIARSQYHSFELLPQLPQGHVLICFLLHHLSHSHLEVFLRYMDTSLT